jgi:O-antigen/teichoic acid export membrane protein
LISGPPPESPPAQVERDPVAHGSALLFWAQLVGNTGLFVALILVTRALGPSGRGTIAFITVGAILLARIARLGVSEATVVFTAQRPPARPALLANLVLSAVAGTAVAVALVCVPLLLMPSLRPSGIGALELGLLALGALGSALADAGYTFILGCSRFRLHAVTTAAAAWLYAAMIAVTWAWTGLTVAKAALGWIAVQAVKGAYLLGVSARDTGVVGPDLPLLGESFRFGLKAWFGSLSDALNDRVDQILTAFIATQAVLGVYAVAVNSSEILLYLPAAAATAVLPVVARSDPRGGAEHVLRAFRSVMLVTLVAVAVGAVLGPPLLPLVFGAPFDASITPFLLLLPGALGYVALVVFSSALVASSRPGRSSVGPVVALVVAVTLDFLLIPPYGASGAAASAASGYLVGGAVALGLYRSHNAFSWRALAHPRRRDLEFVQALVGPLWERMPVRRSS